MLRNDVVTCCFLQISARQVQRSLKIEDINNCTDGGMYVTDLRMCYIYSVVLFLGKCLGYCIECKMVVQTRPIFLCKMCTKVS